jgi:hypothetical protein
MKGGSRVSQMMQFCPKSSSVVVKYHETRTMSPAQLGEKSKTYISYIYGQQTSSHCWLPPILSHAQDSLSVCIVAPHLRLFHVQLSKLLVGALQDFAERTLTDPGARGPTDTWAVSLRAIWVQMVDMYIRIYIYYIIYMCVC